MLPVPAAAWSPTTLAVARRSGSTWRKPCPLGHATDRIPGDDRGPDSLAASDLDLGLGQASIYVWDVGGIFELFDPISGHKVKARMST